MPVTEYTPQGDSLRDMAFYSLTTDPEYIYLPDPNPGEEEHVSDRHRPWSMLEEYVIQKYDLIHTRNPYDAQRREDDRYNEIKSCIIRDGEDRRGKFTILSRQHHRLRPHDEYVFVVYDRPPTDEREPHGAWWYIRAHVRLTATQLHAQFNSDFNRTERSSNDRKIVRKRISWARIPGLKPSRVRTESTTDCNQFLND